MATTLPEQEQDYYLWLEKTAWLLRKRRWENVDVEELAQEVEAMGRSEKRALKSNLIVLLMHLLKMKYQPDKSSQSWRRTIVEHRRRILLAFEDSPSLKPYFREVFDACYDAARRDAATETSLSLETFPIQSSFTPTQVLAIDFVGK